MSIIDLHCAGPSRRSPFRFWHPAVSSIHASSSFNPPPVPDRRFRCSSLITTMCTRRRWPIVCGASASNARSPAGGKEAAALLESRTFEIVITDLQMPDIGGLEVLAKCRELQPDAEVVLVTGHGTIESAVDAMRRGAFNYLLKPLDLKQLRAVVENAVRSQYLRGANAELHRRLDERFGFEGVIGNSPQMHDVVTKLQRIAPMGRRSHGAHPRRHGHW